MDVKKRVCVLQSCLANMEASAIPSRDPGVSKAEKKVFAAVWFQVVLSYKLLDSPGH